MLKSANGDIDGKRGGVTLADVLPPIWALRNNLAAYGAVYVALGEALDAPLLTRDRRLATAASHYARV